MQCASFICILHVPFNTIFILDTRNYTSSWVLLVIYSQAIRAQTAICVECVSLLWWKYLLGKLLRKWKFSPYRKVFAFFPQKFIMPLPPSRTSSCSLSYHHPLPSLLFTVLIIIYIVMNAWLHISLSELIYCAVPNVMRMPGMVFCESQNYAGSRKSREWFIPWDAFVTFLETDFSANFVNLQPFFLLTSSNPFQYTSFICFLLIKSPSSTRISRAIFAHERLRLDINVYNNVYGCFVRCEGKVFF